MWSPSGRSQGSGSVVAVKHTGALGLITLRYRLKDLPVRGASAAFATPAGEFPPGSFLIEAGSQAERIATEVTALGLVGAALPAMPEDVATADVDLPRIAVYTTWANTEKVGWVRLAFDRFEIPFDLIHKDHVQPGARLRVEVRRHRRPAPDPERQGAGLRAAEAVEAAALQEARDVQVAGDVRRDRRRARRHGHQGRGRVRRLRRRGRAC